MVVDYLYLKREKIPTYLGLKIVNVQNKIPLLHPPFSNFQNDFHYILPSEGSPSSLNSLDFCRLASEKQQKQNADSICHAIFGRVCKMYNFDIYLYSNIARLAFHKRLVLT